MPVRSPKPATHCNPIPSLARIASSLALGALAGASGCKKEALHADDTGAAPSKRLPSETSASAALAGDASPAASVQAAGDADAATLLAEILNGAGDAGGELGGLGLVGIGSLQHQNYGGGISVHALGDLRENGGFDQDKARRQVERIAKDLGSCKQPGGPTGHGHVRVVFDHQGRPAQVVVSEPFRGTGVGSCISGRFKRARVPAFEGESPPIVGGIDVGDEP